ncbi:hypothetical protein DUI87_21683 [Hirundo rustica rustica]|uniref:Uncharacterized protein n=1 Tax=Hirundo rustica rustica TaxID=333673 RepID=A0A3M0JSD3_HIRRU|nr:hypothetical protein DUI87_21683 [Hirundo rustica rustica]
MDLGSRGPLQGSGQALFKVFINVLNAMLTGILSSPTILNWKEVSTPSRAETLRNQRWVITNCMKIHKGKCQIVHLGQDNPCCVYSLRGWRAGPWKGPWGSWWMVNWMRVSSALAARRDTPVLGNQAQHRQPGTGGDCPGAASPPVMGQFWVPPYKKRHEAIGECPKEATRMVKGLEGKPSDKWLRSLVLFSLEETGGDLSVVFNTLMRRSRGAGTALFTLRPVTGPKRVARR